ncbi:MAG: glycoside hydrolase family 13 [Verrucomicrobia bacterium]|nr:glycoside hydrolase family 13 [Verrucomicrobiota bacterium]
MANEKLAANGKLHVGKSFTKPINFFCAATGAKEVFIAGDFNEWNATLHPMEQSPDGNWIGQVSLAHGHYRYWFVVDGKPTLDPRAQGISRNEKNERVSLMSVS